MDGSAYSSAFGLNHFLESIENIDVNPPLRRTYQKNIVLIAFTIIQSAAHQSMLQAPVSCTQEHTASQAEVAVEPRVPEAPTVRLDVKHHESALLPLSHWLQLQTWAAGQDRRDD